MDVTMIKEASKKWGIAPQRIGELIHRERIRVAYKSGTVLVMPDNTQKPLNLPSGRKKTNNPEQR